MATAVIATRSHSNTAAGVCSKPESEKTAPCYCPPGTCGIVYLSTHPNTGEKYVGQAKFPIRYFARQREHNRAFRIELQKVTLKNGKKKTEMAGRRLFWHSHRR